MKTVLFYQHFGIKGVVRGAHHKTFDFYHHIKSYSDYKPVIFFDEESVWDENLPWFRLFDKMPTLKNLKTEPDILFLNSGKDWIKYEKHMSIPESIPIISPVNNFRAVNSSHKSFEFLSRKAIRLCPSCELFDAVNNHPNTNGKSIYLPNGVGIFSDAIILKTNKTTDLLIVGNKNPIMAQELYSQIKYLNIKIKVIDSWISKKHFQVELAKSYISVHLPKKIEEHYIPGVEAMMLESLVIIPDCIGNRSYSRPLNTCIIADYSLEGMIVAIKKMLALDEKTKKQMLENAIQESNKFLLSNEKSVLLEMLELTTKLW